MVRLRVQRAFSTGGARALHLLLCCARKSIIAPHKPQTHQHNQPTLQIQTTPLALGLGVAAAAYVSRAALQQYVKFMARPAGLRSFYKGGFEPTMTRREAALILGLREAAGEERVKDAHRRIMVANHPDSGGSSFLAAKVNEAKDVLLGKRKSGGSVF
jgi:DnaJ family protein C protein 19